MASSPNRRSFSPPILPKAGLYQSVGIYAEHQACDKLRNCVQYKIHRYYLQLVRASRGEWKATAQSIDHDDKRFTLNCADYDIIVYLVCCCSTNAVQCIYGKRETISVPNPLVFFPFVGLDFKPAFSLARSSREIPFTAALRSNSELWNESIGHRPPALWPRLGRWVANVFPARLPHGFRASRSPNCAVWRQKTLIRNRGCVPMAWREGARIIVGDAS